MALARPFTITASSAGQRGENIAILRTQYGQVLVEADFSIPGNRALSLTIGVGNPPLKGQLALMALPAKPEASAQPAVLPLGGNAPSAASSELKPGLVVRAMTVGPGSAENPRPVPANLASLAALSFAMPAPVANRASPSVSETAWRVLQAQLLTQSVTAQAPESRSAPPMPLPASAQSTQSISLRILQIAPAPSASGSPRLTDPSVARVVNTTLAGQPIVQLENDVLVLDTQHRIAKGTLLFVERVAMPAPLLGEAETPATSRSIARWSPIADVMNSLTRAELPSIAALRSQMQPTSANFSGAALFLLAALRLGDPKTLLGERGIDMLGKTGRGDLVERLREGARKSSAVMVDSTNGEWRAQSLPMLDGDTIVPIQMAFRRNDDRQTEGEEESAPRSQRFLIDLNPSQIGNLQFEGLLAGSRFDLVLRSEQNLPESLSTDLKESFARALREAGLTGTLAIQNHTNAFVKLKIKKEEVGLVA